jgi:hypothetical protein
MFGELALCDQDLAAPAKTAAAADRVDVHTQTARSLEQRCPDGKVAALAGRREYHKRIASCHGALRLKPVAGDDRLRVGPGQPHRRRRPGALRGNDESSVHSPGHVRA